MNDRVIRAGDTAQRPAAFWPPAIHGLLATWREPVSRPRVLPASAGDSEPSTVTLTWIQGS